MSNLDEFPKLDKSSSMASGKKKKSKERSSPLASPSQRSSARDPDRSRERESESSEPPPTDGRPVDQHPPRSLAPRSLEVNLANRIASAAQRSGVQEQHGSMDSLLGAVDGPSPFANIASQQIVKGGHSAGGHCPASRGVLRAGETTTVWDALRGTPTKGDLQTADRMPVPEDDGATRRQTTVTAHSAN